MQPSLLSTAARYFLEVAEAGSVNHAATKLHVAASAVSRQIAKLEEMLGCELFIRQPRGMALSAAGEKLSGYIRTVNLDTGFLLEEMHGVALQESNHVRIATTEGFSVGIMSSVMATFRANHPNTTLHLHVCSPEGISDALRRGEVDLALKYCVAPEQGLRSIHTERAPVVALVSPSHSLARLKRLSISDMVKHPLALPETGTTARQVFDLCCSMQNIQYTATYVTNTSSAIGLAIRGEAVTLSGHLSANDAIASGTLVAIPFIENPFMERSVQVLKVDSHTLRPIAHAFLTHLVEAIRTATASNRKKARANTGYAGSSASRYGQPR